MNSVHKQKSVYKYYIGNAANNNIRVKHMNKLTIENKLLSMCLPLATIFLEIQPLFAVT